MEVRLATPQDAEELLEIYRYYVEHTAITFEYETPSITEFRQRIKQTLKRYPYLAAVDGHGKIVGYAYALQIRKSKMNMLQKTVFSIMNILVIIWLENFIKAAINSDVGMIWSGWKNILENIKNIQKHLSLFLFYKEFKTFKNQEKLI